MNRVILKTEKNLDETKNWNAMLYSKHSIMAGPTREWLPQWYLETQLNYDNRKSDWNVRSKESIIYFGNPVQKNTDSFIDPQRHCNMFTRSHIFCYDLCCVWSKFSHFSCASALMRYYVISSKRLISTIINKRNQ